MRSAHLVNAGIIVIRYFGGTKLGKTGLIETYGRAAESVIEMAKLYPVRSVSTLRVMSSYDNIKVVEMIIQRTGAERLTSTYQQQVELILRIDSDQYDQLMHQLDEVAYVGIQYERMDSGLVLAGA
jgi:putative IMPACT (imprinted ancient) family translation regulator